MSYSVGSADVLDMGGAIFFLLGAITPVRWPSQVTRDLKDLEELTNEASTLRTSN